MFSPDVLTWFKLQTATVSVLLTSLAVVTCQVLISFSLFLEVNGSNPFFFAFL